MLHHVRALPAQDGLHLLERLLHPEAEDLGEHPDDEHVLADARVGHHFEAGRFHGELDHVEALSAELGHRGRVLLAHLFLRVLGPLALEQHDGAGPEGGVGDPSVEHLLVEGDHQVGALAAVGDLVAAEAHPDARGAGAGSGGRLDLGRNDLDRPDAVAQLGADGAEGLAGLLGAFAGVGDDLDDALLHDGARPRGGLDGSGEWKGGFVGRGHRISSFSWMS